MADSVFQEGYHCHKCTWFKVTSGSGDSAKGECRRYAPGPYPVAQFGNTPSGANSSDGVTWSQANWRWPKCEGDWFCGDYQWNKGTA